MLFVALNTQKRCAGHSPSTDEGYEWVESTFPLAIQEARTLRLIKNFNRIMLLQVTIQFWDPLSQRSPKSPSGSSVTSHKHTALTKGRARESKASCFNGQGGNKTTGRLKTLIHNFAAPTWKFRHRARCVHAHAYCSSTSVGKCILCNTMVLVFLL